MSKMSRLAQAFQQWNPERYKEEEKKVKDQEIERRITALEKSSKDEPLLEGRPSSIRRDAVALTAYLRRNGYPRNPKPTKTTQSDDVVFYQ